MTGYTKLFGSLIGSTIWREDLATKVCWITLLASADRDGIVESSVPGLAHFAGVTVEDADAAVRKFQLPDPYSRSTEHEGRRIEPVDGGWRILNHGKYREKMSPDDLRERARIRQQRFRDRHIVTPERDASVTERDRHNESRMSRHTDTDTDAKADSDSDSKEERKEQVKTNPSAQPKVEPAGSSDSTSFSFKSKNPQAKRERLASRIYDSYPRKVGKQDAIKALAQALTIIANRGVTELHEDLGGDESAAAEWLAKKVMLYAVSPQGKQDHGHIPYPATWVRAGRYDDDPPEWMHVGFRRAGQGSDDFGGQMWAKEFYTAYPGREHAPEVLDIPSCLMVPFLAAVRRHAKVFSGNQEAAAADIIARTITYVAGLDDKKYALKVRTYLDDQRYLDHAPAGQAPRAPKSEEELAAEERASLLAYKASRPK